LELERENPTSVNWSHAHYESLFKASELSRYLVLVAEDSSESKSAAESTPTSAILAYLAAHSVETDWELQYIVVAKDSRRRGVGSCLLGEFISRVRAAGGRRIFLEVRESNHAAQQLYSTLGFQREGLRKSYYSNPPEDAILYQLSLS
jgi:ribosomal-protein-alanine N-acetyltransferase